MWSFFGKKFSWDCWPLQRNPIYPRTNATTNPPSQLSRRPTCSIRLEAIGGQGAHSLSQVIAAAAHQEGYSTAAFSSFGSEKRGTPVKSHIRINTSGPSVPMRNTSAIINPDILVVFHERMLITTPEILAVAGPETDVIVNTSKTPTALPLWEHAQIRSLTTLDGHRITQETGSGINAVLLGALQSLLPEVPATSLSNAFRHRFQHIGSKALMNNLQGLRRGASEAARFFPNKEQFRQKSPPLLQPQFTYQNAPLGGVISGPGNTVLHDHSSSRKGFAPWIDFELCFHCGRCDLVCPDYCFVWGRNEQSVPILKGVDLQYCKGCQKCAEACPVEAIQVRKEEPDSHPEIHLHPDKNLHLRQPFSTLPSKEKPIHDHLP